MSTTRTKGSLVSRLLTLLALCLPAVCSAAPGCKSSSQTNAEGVTQTIRICVKQGTFAHDVYTVTLNGKQVLQKIDDEMLSFAADSDGKKLVGACEPQLQKEKLGSREVSVEIGRICTISLDGQPLDALEFKFE